MERASRRLIGIIGTFLIVFLFGAGSEFYKEYISPAFNPATATPYPTIPPPPTSRPRPTPTDSCLHWSQITPQMAGQIVCVYGEALFIYPTDLSATRIKFSKLNDSFFIEDITYTYPDLRPGDCVRATSLIRLYGDIPHMQINGELYTCN